MTVNLELSGCTVSGIGVGKRGEVIEISLISPSGARYTLCPHFGGHITVDREEDE